MILPKGRYVLAISGGVDSVVLLDLLSKQSDLKIIVASFDHGIRSDSVDDIEFVRLLSEKYGLDFITKRVELGVDASEAEARKARYAFLNSVAKEKNAKLITAHHCDDVIETIAINLYRGTGWRGLAAMDSDVIRPLVQIGLWKNGVLEYATENKLQWREDSTNSSDKYLRNRIRQKIYNLDMDVKMQLLALWNQQKSFKNNIDEIVVNFNEQDLFARKNYINLPEAVSLELIRFLTNAKLTRPQMNKVLNAIKTYLPSKTIFPGGDIKIDFSSRNFSLKLIK